MNTTNYPDTMSTAQAEPRRWRRLLTTRPRDGREMLAFVVAAAAATTPWLVINRAVPSWGTLQLLLVMPAVLALSMTLAMWPVAAWQQRRSPNVRPQRGYPRPVSAERERPAAEVSSA